jgi:hypothetical protein
MTVMKSLVVHIPFQNSKWFGEQRVGTVSTKSSRGKHMTCHVSLLLTAGGGFLADASGFDQPTMLKVTNRSLQKHFKRFVSTVFNCVFLVTTPYFSLYYGLQVSKICINKIIHVSQIFKYEY